MYAVMQSETLRRNSSHFDDLLLVFLNPGIFYQLKLLLEVNSNEGKDDRTCIQMSVGFHRLGLSGDFRH